MEYFEIKTMLNGVYDMCLFLIQCLACIYTLQIFLGNMDNDEEVRHELYPPMEALTITLYPKTWEHHISLRWELYSYNYYGQCVPWQNFDRKCEFFIHELGPYNIDVGMY